ncbi:MAG: hypothetical protein KF847_01395 [Pirellulales bacterium]|nr:hypothetical protein [Pirellulales bacterium]
MAASHRPDLSASPAALGASAWPVLARLPRLAEGDGARLPTFDSPAADDLPLTVDEPHHVSFGGERRTTLDEPSLAARQYLDGRHDDLRQREFAPVAPSAPPLETYRQPERRGAPAPIAPPAPLRRRIDRGEATSAGVRAPGVGSAPTAGSRLARALSSQAFDAHSTVAQYASLIVTAALVAAAGLLYWLMLGPTTAPGISGVEPLRREWSRVNADQTARLPEAVNVTGQTDAPLPAHHLTCVSLDEAADQIAARSAASATALAEPSVVARQAGPAKPETSFAAPAAESPALAVAPLPPASETESPSQSAVTTAPAPAAYPTTGRAPFDAARLPSRTDQVDVARRPVESGAAALR